MATTTNYSWTTPDDTDLVKDGAAAIRTLGSSIDTTVFNNAGAAIQKSIFDAAGDVIYATANDTPARLALGTAGQVLTVNSGATAPEWTTPAGAAASCVLTKSAAQTIPAQTNTAVTWNTELIDTDAFHSTVSNTSRITIPAALGGKYLITGTIQWNMANNAMSRLLIYKNNAQFSYNQYPNDGEIRTNQITMVMNLSVGDYIELYVYQDSGGSNDLISATSGTYMNASTFQATRIGS